MYQYRIVYETETTLEDGGQLSVDIETDLPLYSTELGTWHNDRVTEVLRTIGRNGGHNKVAVVRIMEAAEINNETTE